LRTRSGARAIAAWSLAVAAALHTAAAADRSPVIQEVVVTAQKRTQNAQDVPISMAVFNARTLDLFGVDDIHDLRRITPNLYIATAPQVTNTRVAIRGIGTSGNTAIEPSVAFFVDGVYAPRVGSMLAGLNDVEAVEILRGPQGTLFGRNASAGAISMRTVAARDELEASLSAETGSYGYWQGAGMINAPITEDFALRLSVLREHSDGAAYEELSDKAIGASDTLSVRGSSRWDITPDVIWVMHADYQTLKGDGLGAVSVVAQTITPAAAASWRARLDPDGAGPMTGDLPLLDDTYSRRVRQESAGSLQDEQYGLTSDLTWSLAQGWMVRVITGYRDWRDEQVQSSTAFIPLALTSRVGSFDSRSVSNEVQLISPAALLGGRASLVAGIYYYDEKFQIGEDLGLAPGYCQVFIRNTQPTRVAACQAGLQSDAVNLQFDQTTTSRAGYVQGTYRLAQRWDVTAGLRYSHDEKRASFLQQSFNVTAQRADESTDLELAGGRATYHLGTSFRPLADVMLFATWSTGYKSGGFDSGGGNTALGQARIVQPETTQNYELGARTLLFDRRLLLNATLYRMTVEDLQFRTFDGFSFRVRNNGTIRQQGVEFDVVGRPGRALTLSLSGAYLDSEYLNFTGAPGLPALGGVQDLTGERVPFSPEFTAAAAAQYEIDLPWQGLSLQLHGDASYSSELSLSAAGDNSPDAMEPEHSILGARLSLIGAHDRWELALIARNLTDELACGTRFAQPNDAAFGLRNPLTGGTVLRCTLSEPRSFAVAAKARF
jgi:iron complex outermembrane receptor protein